MDIKELFERIGIFPKSHSNAENSNILETSKSILLPNDYKIFLNFYNPIEKFIGNYYIVLMDLDSLILDTSNIVDNQLGKFLIFGNNGSSENFLLRCGNENNLIYLVSSYDIDEIENWIIIGDSFTNFIERLLEGTDWF
jgi:hypothetical protein